MSKLTRISKLKGIGSYSINSLGTRPYVRIWVWLRSIEGFVSEECNYCRLLINVIVFIHVMLIMGISNKYLHLMRDITCRIESWKFRSESNKNGSTKENHFPPHVGSNTKVLFPAVKLCTASCCSFL